MYMYNLPFWGRELYIIIQQCIDVCLSQSALLVGAYYKRKERFIFDKLLVSGHPSSVSYKINGPNAN